jgi:hypothetical protein
MNEANMPPEVLEMKAAEQRRRLHNSVSEIKSQVRETLDIKKNAREYIVPASAAAAVLGLFLGFAAGGMVTG